MKTFFLFLTSALFAFNHATAQWTKINAIPTQHIVALTTFNDTLLAATDTNLLYKSVDGGSNWTPMAVSSNPIVIICLKVIGDRIYVGTNSDGIFSSADYGHTWLNTGSNLLPVIGIEARGSDLFAATLGNGVYVLHQNSNNWIPFNNSLPSYSVNVFTMLSTPASLFIGAGANGTFYRYNFDANAWNEEFYYGFLRPGLLIEKLINNSDTLFAVNGNNIIRSDDNGLNWADDVAGSHDGFSRTIYSGTNNYYTITNRIQGGTWIQQRSKLAAPGTTWAINEELLPSGYSYDIIELQNKLFLSRADGLYSKDLLVSGVDETNEESSVNIVPNPSHASPINISCSQQVRNFTITTLSGQVLYSENIGKSEFTLPSNLPAGGYFINLNLLSGERVVRKVIIE